MHFRFHWKRHTASPLLCAEKSGSKWAESSGMDLGKAVTSHLQDTEHVKVSKAVQEHPGGILFLPSHQLLCSTSQQHQWEANTAMSILDSRNQRHTQWRGRASPMKKKGLETQGMQSQGITGTIFFLFSK